MQLDIRSFQSISGNIKLLLGARKFAYAPDRQLRMIEQTKGKEKPQKNVTKRLKLRFNFGNSKTPRTVRNEKSSFSLVIFSFSTF